jgi:hypothetical protein
MAEPVSELSDMQAGMLRALNRLGAHEASCAVTVRQAGPENGQSTDGAAYTLRSLVRRELVARQYGEPSLYWLTTDGLIQALVTIRHQLTARQRELDALPPAGPRP